MRAFAPAVLALLLWVAGAAAQERTLTWADGTDVVSLDGGFITDLASTTLLKHVAETLVRLDATLAVEAGPRRIVERREGRRDLDLPVAPRAEIFIGGARHRAGREVQPRAHPRSEDGGGQPFRAGVDRLRRCRG
jgi:hypothetical protein